MKRSKEIIGVPVISIAEGVQIGTVKGFVINPQLKAVEFLLVNENEDSKGSKGIPFRSAEGVGEFAVTVENRNILFDTMKVGVLDELVHKGIGVIGTKIITKKGKYLGDVLEFSLDTDNGALCEFFYKGEGDGEKSVASQNVITIGKEVLVIEEEAAAPPQEEIIYSQPREEPKGNFNGGNEGSLEDKSVDSIEEEQVSSPDNGSTLLDAPVSEENKDLDPAKIFVQRQRQYLIGKLLLKDIKTDLGEVIAWENDVVSEDLFNRIYNMGTQKLMELAMSVRE